MVKKLLKLVFTLFFLVVVTVLIYQGYKLFKPAYVTERAVLYTMQDTVSCYGVAVRDETTVSIDKEGTLSFKVNNGQKVAAGSIIADVYSSVTIAEDVMIHEILKAERDTLMKAGDAASNSSINLDSVSNSIQQTVIELSRCIDRENYSEYAALKLRLTEQLYTFSMNIYPEINIDSSIERLNAELAVIEGHLNQTIDEIRIKNGGYFVSYIDNLEYLKYRDGMITKLSFAEGEEELTVLSVDDIWNLLESSDYLPNHNSCKVISDYVWYFAAIIDSSYVNRFFQSQKLKLDLDRFYEKNLPVQIEKIIAEEGSDRALIIFSCDRLNEELAGLRAAEGNISFRSYTGIRVPRSAIYIEDGEIGVYVKYDNKMLFKKISYEFETPEYVLVTPSQKTSELRLYDEIIIEGKDLHNGKSI